MFTRVRYFAPRLEPVESYPYPYTLFVIVLLGEWRYSSTHSWTSALDGGEWSASCPGRFTPRERAPGTHWIGVWVGSSAVLNEVVKRKIPSPRPGTKLWNPNHPVRSPALYRLSCHGYLTLFRRYELYQSVSRSFRTGRLERELQMV
jgi:hypothetical protein